MEPKKNQKYDVHHYRAIILNISLMISLAIVITAFEWTVPVEHPKIVLTKKTFAEDPIIVPITRFERPPEPSKPREIEINLKPQHATEFTTVPDDRMKEPLEPAVDQNNPVVIAPIEYKIEIEKEPEVYDFTKVEKMPQPVGGLSAFRDLLLNKLKYPLRAVRNETEGKVFVGFTVDEKGELSDFYIQKGIGDGCDEEAIRVIKMSKWEPGKQRGKPVKVRMQQPITFSLH